MTGRQKGNGGPEKGRAPVSIAMAASFCPIILITLATPFGSRHVS
jgi:hypothetical protein